MAARSDRLPAPLLAIVAPFRTIMLRRAVSVSRLLLLQVRLASTTMSPSLTTVTFPQRNASCSPGRGDNGRAVLAGERRILADLRSARGAPASCLDRQVRRARKCALRGTGRRNEKYESANNKKKSKDVEHQFPQGNRMQSTIAVAASAARGRHSCNGGAQSAAMLDRPLPFFPKAFAPIF